MPSTQNRQTESAGVLPRAAYVPSVPFDAWPPRQRPRAALIGTVDGFFTTAISIIFSLLALPVLMVLKSRAVRRTLFGIAVLNISFPIQKHFFLQEDVANLGALGGLQVSVTGIALAALCVSGFVGIATGSRSFVLPRLDDNVVILPGALLLVLNLVSVLVAGDVRLALFQLFSILILFYMLVYVAETVRTREDVLFIVRILLIGLVIQSCFMLAQAAGLVGDIQFYFIKTTPGTFVDGRVFGTLGSPNKAAAYLAMIVPLALGLLLGSASRVDKCLATIALSLAALSLIFTGSRGGWISLVVSLAAILLFGGRRIPWKLVSTVLVALILLTIPFEDTIKERLYGDDKGSAESRVPMNKLAFEVIGDHPLMGVGANNYPLVMRLYAARGGLLDAFDYAVHNTYLLTWAETGIGGLIALIWFLIAVIRQGLLCWRFQDPLLAPMALGCVAAVLGLMAHMGVDTLLRPGSIADLLWLFAGLVVAISRVCHGGPSTTALYGRSVERLN